MTSAEGADRKAVESHVCCLGPLRSSCFYEASTPPTPLLCFNIMIQHLALLNLASKLQKRRVALNNMKLVWKGDDGRVLAVRAERARGRGSDD